MKNGKLLITAALGIAVVAATGIGGFVLGKTSEQKLHQKEKEFSIQLKRSELDGLGEIKGTVYVTGHKSPDSDTVGSSIAYASLLRALGYDATPVILGNVNHETAHILKKAGADTPMLLEDASGLNMVLVDHSENVQSADGLKDANIIGIIDHHAAGSVTSSGQLIYDARPLGSTATIIWLRYKDYGLVPDKQTAYVMTGAILSDTKNLTSESTTFADKEALKELSSIAGVKDTDALYQEMYKESLSYDGMTDEEIFFSDYKEYECGGFKYSIGCIKAYDEQSAKDLAQRMKKAMPATLSKTGMDMSFAQINITRDDISVTYLVPSNDAANEVIKTAFGDKTSFDGTSYRAEPNLSRKKDVAPAITGILEAHPK